MLPFSKSDLTVIGRAVASDNDTSEVLFDGTKAVEANAYESVKCIALVEKSASDAANTVTIKFYGKDTNDGAVGTWNLIQADSAVAVDEPAGLYAVESTIPMRLCGYKYVTAQVTLALTDPGTDRVMVGALLQGEIARRDV